MKQFLDENFLLQNGTAQRLYHEFAKDLQIIDYHNHLPPQQIADNINFENLTQAWLYGDHYKWRAMRTNAVAEDYCTGSRSDYEKFEQWALTVPYTLRNPLYQSTIPANSIFQVNPPFDDRYPPSSAWRLEWSSIIQPPIDRRLQGL